MLARSREALPVRSSATQGSRQGRLRRLARFPWRLPARLTPRRAAYVAFAVSCAALLFALLFQPYGPWNATGPDAYPVAQIQHVNQTFFDEMTHLIDLVPRSTPYFLFQNDMPYALPRTLTYLQTPLISSEILWGNATLWDAIHDQFPLTLFNGHVVEAQVNYLLDNPQGRLFYATANAGISMFNFVRVTYESGLYGVLGQASGMTLLERGYAGPVQYYVAYARNFSAAELWSWQTSAPSGGSVIERSNVSGGRLWWGPYALLSPGTYSATVWLRTSDVRASNHLTVEAVADGGKLLLASTVIHGDQFPAADQWEPFPISFTLNDTYSSIEVASWNVNWVGTLGIEGVNIAQVSPAANPLM